MGDGTPARRAGLTARLAKIVDQLLAPVVVVAADGRITYVNESSAHLMGVPPSWLVGRTLLDFVHPSDRRRARRRLEAVAAGQTSTRTVVYRLRANSGQDWREIEAFPVNLIDEPGVRGILIAGRDVTEARAHEHQLRELAYRDALTGLPNRLELHGVLDRLLKGGRPLAAGFVGLDRFKLINDSLGHGAGDEVLRIVANRIAQSTPPGAATFRFNGDVFAVVAAGDTAEDPRTLWWGVVERIAEPVFLAGHELRLSASCGIVERDASSTTESLLRHGELALHHARARGGGRVEHFEPAMREAALARLELEANLRFALAESQFALALQPVVDLASRRPLWSEALLRWYDGRRDIAPATFISIAEETGLILALGDWIIDRAAHLVPVAPGGRVFVNLSGRQLASPWLPNRIARVMVAHQLPAASVGFEVTETVLIEQFDHATGVLQEIRELGHRVGLDDFGTGYSSLSYLRRLPIDFLKVDRSLIVDVDTDAQARTIVGAIIAMAGALGLDVIAEGVETEGQSKALEDLGCPYAQGYLFGRPELA